MSKVQKHAENAVDHEFDQFEWCHFGANVTGVVASDGDACSIWVSLLWTDFAYNIAVADFWEMISGNVSEVNNVKGVGAINWLCGEICASEALAEMTKFFGVGGAPDLLVLWMFDKLAVFEGLSSVAI